VEDFISCGLEALIKSIDRYDPEKGATLEQFAWTRIHGAILDELRRQDWAPRSLRRREREMTQARDQFTGVHGRPPTRTELAEALSVSTDDLRALEADISRSDVGSLNATVLHDENDTIERIDTLADEDAEWDPEAAASREQAKERLRLAFRTLPPREQEVAVMLYVMNLTQREVGEILNVTESRISQIHTQLRKKLKTALASDALLFSEVA
jgi:RNA polymerase sigma factor for flagellar operon FliA